MRRRLAWLCLGLAVPLAAADPPKAVPLLDVDALSPDEAAEVIEGGALDDGVAKRARVESGSGQFGVSGGTAGLRSSLALQAEGFRRELHRLLGLVEEPVTVPVEIILHGQAGDPPRVRALALDARFTKETYFLNLHVDLSRGIDHDRLQREIVRALVYQQSLKEMAPGEHEGVLKVPVWLVEGLLEALRWRGGTGDRRLYEGVFQSEGRFTTDRMLEMGDREQARLDGVSRDIFRVLSGALVMALLEQPGGRASLASFCGEIATFRGETPILLRRHFPELNLSRNSLEKWWALTLAKMADAPLTDSMTIAETERQLGEALILRFESGGLPREVKFNDRGEADELSEAERLTAIRPAQQALNRLSYRCFPSYRPLLVEYQELLAGWATDGPDPELDSRLLDLSETRALMEGRALRARDFLDYMQIAGATELSGNFEDYLRLKRELAERPRIEKEDPVSAYLDRMDRVYDPRSGR